MLVAHDRQLDLRGWNMTVPYDYDQDSIDHLREVIAEQEQTIECLHERCKAEEVENHKLRELIKLMQICIEHACMCDFCPLFVSEDMDEQRCIAEIDSRMRELETEVD